MRKRAWVALVEEWRSSGLSQSEFCRRKGITASTFHHHVTKSVHRVNAKPGINETFVRLGEFIEIELPGGMLARIPASACMLKILLESSGEIAK